MMARLRQFIRSYGWQWLVLHIVWAGLIVYTLVQLWQEDPFW